MDLFRNNQREFTGSNEDFVDTAPGVPKILSVEYDIVYPDGIVENEYFEKGEHEDPFEIEVPLDAEIEYLPKKTPKQQNLKITKTRKSQNPKNP